MTLLDAASRAEARDRIAFVTDMTVVVGGLFGGGKQLTEHLDQLNDIVTGE